MVRKYAQDVGIVIILIGVVGVIAGEEPLLGLVNVDVIHLVLGILGITVAWVVRNPARMRAA
ncbi:MAG: hypothetical protein ACRDRH_18320 [Pseudonocardia sp.]